MKTLLVLAEHPEFAEALRASLDPERYRLMHRPRLEEAEPLLVHGLADACIVDVEVTTVQGIWLVEKLRQRAPRCPLVVYTAAKGWEWEEEAYLKGVSHVLAKPLNARVLSALLDRLWTAPVEAIGSTRPVPATPEPGQSPRPPSDTAFFNQPPASPTTAHALHVLRDFSGILTESLNAEGMLKQFLLLLRQLLSINRATIFLRQPLGPYAPSALPENRRLRAACSVGVASGLLQHFELSLESGIGAHLLRSGRILRRQSQEARNDLEAQKEFDLLGGQVAVPIVDRETILGVAVFDGRITDEPLVNSELELIFHLLEQLGLVIKNIWLHDQLASNHELLAGILRELPSACIVVSRDLAVLHANKMARKCFAAAERRGGELQFNDLPQALGGRIYQVLKSGSAIAGFKYEPPETPSSAFNVSIVPFPRSASGPPASALLMAQDITQTRQLQQLEIEAANLRLVKTMADRLTHEIGNAMVPLSTHQQLLADKWKDAEFRSSLDGALADGVKRVTRLVNQMRYLARDSLISHEPFPVAPLLEEAYQEARKYQSAKGHLKLDAGAKPFVVNGDRAALKHAFTEVLLNALQANPADPKVGVRLQADLEANGSSGLQIEVQDNGAGFSAESAQKASAPFYTTRNVGLGLGLAVSRKIIETHQGKLEVVTPKPGQSGLVRISLPVEPAK